MAINWTEGVFRNSKQTGTDLLLLLILADSADRDTGACYPGVKTLARLMRSSERNVQLRLKALKDSGELTVRYQKSPFGTNLYVLNRSLLGDEAQFTPQAQESEGVKPTSPPDDEGVNATSPQGVKPTSPKPSVRTIKKTKAKETDESGFAEWYALYPRKVSRLRAVEAWAQLSPDDRAAAMEALPRHVAVFATREFDKIPHPATWLNARRWEDVLPEVTAPATGHAPEGRTRIDTEARFPDGTPCWLWLDNRVIDLRKPENAHYRERVAS